MNNNHWIHNELLLECIGVDVDCRVGVEVGLNNLNLLKRILEEPDNTQWTRIYRVAEETSYELLGERGHLGILAWKSAWNTWDLLVGLRATFYLAGP